MNEVGALLQDSLFRLADNRTARAVLERPQVLRDVVRRYVAGESIASALDATMGMRARGRKVSLTRLARQPRTATEIAKRGAKYRKLLRRLGEAGLSQEGAAEISTDLRALGSQVGPDGPAQALEQAHQIAEAAQEVGALLMIESEAEATADATLEAVATLRAQYPQVGVALPVAWRRTASDCADLTGPGIRVRLYPGTTGPDLGSHAHRHDVDVAFVRCLRVLMAGRGHPIVATADARILRIAKALATHLGRSPDSYEYQIRYGVRPTIQTVIADRGDQMRVYVPFGEEWYPYLVRRLAEHPTDFASILRATLAR